MEPVDSQKIARQNQRAYDIFAVAYAKQWAMKPDIQLADEFLTMMSGRKILDVGCGPGHYSSHFIDKGYSVDAIDTSYEMLRIAKERDSRIRTRSLDMSKLDYSASTFDGLWVCASLPHIPKEQVDAVLQGFRRVLKHDGCMLVNVIIGSLEYRIETSEEMGSETGEPGRFFQWYPTPSVFKEILDQAGFRVEIERHRNLTSKVLKNAKWPTNSWYNCFCHVK